MPSPLEDKRRELREEALTQVINGEASPQDRGVSTVLKVGETAESAPATGRQGKNKDQYVELARETTDRIFVILAEFGDERHANYPDKNINPAIPGPATFEGPLHNQIPEPDRSVDNSTVWQPDYDQEHYQQLYFGTARGDESLKKYYEKQSSGRYSVDGIVTDWVKVQYNEARYGRSNDPIPAGRPGDDPAVCSANVCSNTWNLIQDAANQWVEDQRAAGSTDEQIAAELATFDVWDRYDHDGDGNFNEPDGYIDHFQIVHAGGDQADGDPHQGEDAIWSHRWYAFFDLMGEAGPTNNLLGGTQFDDLGLWVGDYTIQPENGGRSVFYHEYGHDLGLPDLYDTASGADQIGWWSIMAQSRLSAAEDVGIGTRGADLGPWEKLQLGWLDYEITLAGQERTMWLGPHEYNSPRPQALVTVLPQKEVVTDLVEPYEGEHSWYSGHDNDYNATMSRQLTLPAGSATLTFQAAYDIEDCGTDPCDYAYVEVDNGSGWKSIPGSITKAAEDNGIDGTSDELGTGHVRLVGLRRADDRAAVPVHHRRRRRREQRECSQRPVRRRHPGRRERNRGVRRRCRGRRQRLDARRLLPRRRHGHESVRQLLHLLAPQLRLLRPVPGNRPVQLRLPRHPAGLGRALQLHGGVVDLVLGHLAVGQQHQRARR